MSVSSMRLKDKVCAITGAGSGIGEAAARLFAAEGARILVLEIDATEGRRVADDIGSRAAFLHLDVSDPTAVAEAFRRIDTDYGRLDGLYNNASIFLGDRDASVADLDLDVYQRVIACNQHGVVYCCKFAIPLLERDGGGTIVNTASSAAISGVPGCDAYTASKGATMALSRALAVAYAPRGIRVNCIAPAGISTPMIQQSNLGDPNFDEKAFLNKTPVRRWGRPEDIAQVALFLTSDASSYVNGAVVVADGGITVTPMF